MQIYHSFLELKPYVERSDVFGNDVLHRGCEYREKKIFAVTVRRHCNRTLDRKDFKREEGKTVDFVHELMEASELAKMFDGKQYKATCLPKKRIL